MERNIEESVRVGLQENNEAKLQEKNHTEAEQHTLPPEHTGGV